jgi:hypothetical protein
MRQKTSPGVIERDFGVRNGSVKTDGRDIKGANAIMPAATVSFVSAQ